MFAVAGVVILPHVLLLLSLPWIETVGIITHFMTTRHLVHPLLEISCLALHTFLLQEHQRTKCKLLWRCFARDCKARGPRVSLVRWGSGGLMSGGRLDFILALEEGAK